MMSIILIVTYISTFIHAHAHKQTLIYLYAWMMHACMYRGRERPEEQKWRLQT